VRQVTNAAREGNHAIRLLKSAEWL